jgi:hypothetical protein
VLIKFWLGLMIAFFVCMGSACAPLQLNQAKQSSVNEMILYQEDFSSPDSGWNTWKQDASQVYYKNGGLVIKINKPRFDYWSRPGKRFADARIAVDATRLSGPENNDFGIICRYRNSDNFYGFFASSDRYFGIIRVKDGKYEVLSGPELQFSDTIQKSPGTNQLRADCIGNTLTFYINGKQMAQVADTTFKSGEVGILAGTYDEPGVEILFDNFIVLKP